jgi:hypothetical protein
LILLLGGSYGGERLFRIYFFTLPFMALLGAMFFFPTERAGHSWWTTLLIMVVSWAMLIGLGFAYYGKDQQFYFTPGEITATAYLEQHAPPGALIVLGTHNFPVRFRNHTFGTRMVSFSLENPDDLKEMLADPETVFLNWMTDEQYPASYMIITRSMKVEEDMLGQMPPGALHAIETQLRESPYFELFYANRDASIFVVAESVRALLREPAQLAQPAGSITP